MNMKERFGKPIPTLTAVDVIANAGNNSGDRENSGNKNEGRWSDSEHINFLKALKKWGRDWKHVAAFVRSRTSTQCRSHAQKFIAGLEKQGKTLETYLLREFDENQEVPIEMIGDDEMSKTVTESAIRDEDDTYKSKSDNEGSKSELKAKRLREKEQKLAKVRQTEIDQE